MPAPISSWTKLGYSSTPYSTAQIPSGERGEKLLIGRAVEMEQIHRKLVNGVNLIAIEGDYGVGKSSLATVAAYEASRWHLEGDNLFIPAIGMEALELQEDESPDSFKKRVYYRIAAAFISNEAMLKSNNFELKQMDSFARWLNGPSGSGWSAGIGASLAAIGGFNLNLGRSSGVNSAPGFNDSGIYTMIDSWLAEISRGNRPAGVICVLDNLENLRHFKNAERLFESLRDGVFRRPGVVWIVCGAEGMVTESFSSRKIFGTFHPAIDVPPLNSNDIPRVIEARAESLKTRADAELPVSTSAFGRLYEATGHNLRFAFGLADSYASSMDVEKFLGSSVDDRELMFQGYLTRRGDDELSKLRKNPTKADWKVLKTLVTKLSGVCSPSSSSEFGYSDMPQLIVRVKALRNVGLVTYETDEEDGRRRLISATAVGRLVLLGSREF
ncbi:hypothetical protein SANBI_000287 [Sanguibacter sp. 4.1]|uniref:Uncharacterized protein n=1 Tax=Sanguibacter biliveldensis TaxID=3030830 RepID=A0AAF0Z875_9MICO|nr:hypothetical protein [Sanguibacter sp. 4.1]WPF82676.1 hypothetical protein SANBI_000287 [Sanguibacter sp. 4.1]